MSKNKKSNLIIIPILLATSIAIVFSGCAKKQAKELVVKKHQEQKTNNNQEQQKTIISTTTSPNISTSTEQITPSTKTDCQDELNTSCWNTYRNEKLGIEFRYPKQWQFAGNQLHSFATPFKEYGVSFEYGVFENPDISSPKEWVDKRDFFQQSQLKEKNLYIAYGINGEPQNITTKDGVKLLNYKGRASGGGAFETAIIPFNDKMIVITYSLTINPLININEQLTKTSNIFNKLLRFFKIIKMKNDK